MNFSKVTSILVALFVIVNLFLGGNLMLAYRDSQYPADTYVENVETVLLKNGVTVSREVLSRRYLQPVTYQITVDENTEAKIAKKILGDTFERESVSGVFSFRSGDNHLQMQSGIWFSFEGTIGSSGSGIENEENRYESLTQSARQFLQKMNPKTEARFTTMMFGAEEAQIIFEQYYLGNKIKNNTAVFTVKNGMIVSARGDYIYGEMISSEVPMPKDPINALMTFATDISEGETEIVEVSVEYIVNKQARGTFLNPVWNILDAEGNKYFFDFYGIFLKE